MQQRVSELIAVGSVRIADGTLIGVANYAGCPNRSEFAGTAAYGYCAFARPAPERYHRAP